MAVAVAKAVEARRRRGHLRLDRQHGLLGGGLRRPRRADGRRSLPGGSDRGGEARAVARRRRAACSRCAAASTRRCGAASRSPSAAASSLVNSLNPHRIEGQKTAAFEIVEQLGGAPDVLALPYGGGGNTVAYAKGFAEERRAPADRLGARRSSARRRSPRRSGSPSRRTSPRSRRSSPTADVEPVPVSDEDITRMWLELAQLRGHLLRAVLGGRPRRARAGRARAGRAPSSASSPATV